MKSIKKKKFPKSRNDPARKSVRKKTINRKNKLCKFCKYQCHIITLYKQNI